MKDKTRQRFLKEISNLKKEKKELLHLNKHLTNLVQDRGKYDWALPIIEENNHLKEQLALAFYDNERLMFELSYYQHICKHLVVK